MPPGSADLPTWADHANCRALLRSGSKSFFAASLLLPPRVRDPACAIYAFCRLADDAIDVDHGRFAAIKRLRDRLDRAYAGRPLPISADRAFAEAVWRFGIPRALPEALLEGFAWDAEARRYPDLSALHAYASRVAASVGAIMALLMDQRDPDVLARACDLGIAMQLTNIARDVGEDARAGRLYLPLDWLAEERIDPDAFLAAPQYTAALGRVVARLLAEAERLYRRAEAGIARLPANCRAGIGAARLIYAEIGRAVERNGLDSVSVRAVVPKSRKLMLLAAARARTAFWPLTHLHDPPVEAARFLVEAAAAASPALAAARGFDARVAWLVSLYDRLERRDRAPRALLARAAR